MEYVIILITLWLVAFLLKILFGYNLKKIKKEVENKELDEIVKKYPENKVICEEYLRKLNNEKVEIEENDGTENSLYIAISNKILIGNIKNSYSRIQTIAHECLHSIQDRKLQIFNFVYSNIYMLFFIVITLMALFKALPYKMMFNFLLMFMGLVYYMVRTFLENDAMIKARYLAKEYMEEKKISSKEEIEKIVDGFDKINNIGIKCVNYSMFFNVTMINIVFSLVCLIR
ncbi:MAG: zinc metallopeptidase [Clostridium sp.]|nr:zinc metallopeptidase [Clostridium sp.]